MEADAVEIPFDVCATEPDHDAGVWADFYARCRLQAADAVDVYAFSAEQEDAVTAAAEAKADAMEATGVAIEAAEAAEAAARSIKGYGVEQVGDWRIVE